MLDGVGLGGAFKRAARPIADPGGDRKRIEFL